MKMTQVLQHETPSLSFEVFPPKTDTAFASVKAATEEIADLKPAFVSVTYGAGGGTSKYTLEIAKTIKEAHGVPTLAHLTCVSSTKEEIHLQSFYLQDKLLWRYIPKGDSFLHFLLY